ncbi:MAG: hypothetical protein R3A48_00475 [Polyangiales bacterium]
MTAKEGFSVVAPTRVTVPASAWGSCASCCARLYRWSSSTKSTVRAPCARSCSARAMTCRTSATPASTAESCTKRPRECAAMARATVVFPHPGEPQRIIDGARSARIARPSGLSGPRASACPRSSSRVRGRMRSARGASGAGSAGAGASASAGGAR